jgi:hypothetical protein
MTLSLAAIISTALLTKLAIFVGVAAGAWWLLELLAAGKPRAERRLEEFREPNLRRGDLHDRRQSVAKRSDGMTRLLEKASPKMSITLASAANWRRPFS